MDVAELQMTADAKGIDRGTDSLRKLEDQAGRTEKATDRMNRENEQSAMSYQKMSSSVMRLTAQYLGFAAAVQALRGGINIIGEFGAGMSKVAAISGATAEEMVGLTQAARTLGATTSYSAGQAAEGLAFLAQGGFTAKEAIESIPAVLDLAKSSAMDLGSAAGITTNVLNGFGIQAKDAATAVDVMAAVSARSNTDVSQLGEAVGYVGPVAAAMGVSLGEASAAMGVLSDAGIQGSSAGTGLRRVLSALAAPTKEAAGVIEGLGLKLEDVNPATNELTDVIDALATTGMSAADALTIFGDRGGPAILALVAENERVRELAEQLENVDGEAKRMAETMGDNLPGDIAEFTSAIEELVLTLGDAGATKVLRGFVQTLTGFVGELKWAVDEIRAGFGAINDQDYARLAERAEKLKEIIAYQNTPMGKFFGNDAELKKNEKELANLQKRMEKLISLHGNAKKSQAEWHKEWDASLKKSAALINETSIEFEGFIRAQHSKALAAGAEEAKEFAESLQELKDAADPLKADANQLTKEFEMMHRGMREGKVSAEEWTAFLDYAFPEVVVKAKRLKTAVKEVKEETDVMAVSFERGIERMRDGVGEFFQDLLKGGEFSFDKLGDMFRDMIAEMIATAAANQIFIGLGITGQNGKSTMGKQAASLLGGGEGGISEMFKSGGGGISGMLSGAANGFGASMSGIYANAATGLRNIGLDSVANFADAQAGIYGQGGMTSVAYGAANIGAGILGGWAGGKVFGESEEQSMGAMAGGAIGSFAGPIGTAVGAFIGSAIGDFFKKGVGNNAAGADFNLSTGKIESKTWGKNGSDPQNVEGSKNLAEAIKMFSDSIGGSDLSANITSGSKKGLQYGGQSYGQNADALLQDAFDDVIEHSTTLRDELKPLMTDFVGTAQEIGTFVAGLAELDKASGGISDTVLGMASRFKGSSKDALQYVATLAGLDAQFGGLSQRAVDMIETFQGTNAQLLQFATGVATIDGMLQKNPVQTAIDDVMKAQENVSKGVMGLYMDQLSVVNELAAAYDGSATASTKLSEAMFQSQQAAYQMAMAVQQIREQSSALFADSAKSIRESVMSEQQLYAAREKERADLMKSITDIQDVNKLQEALSKLNEVNNLMFRSIKDPTVAQAEQFAKYAEDASKAVNGQLTEIMETLKDTQQSQMDRVESVMQSTADRQEAAMSTFEAAVNKFDQVISTLSVGATGEVVL